MNVEIIVSSNNPVAQMLNWLLAIDTETSPSAMESELPRASWQAALHPVVSYGEAATLQGCISAPFEDGPIISVTFTKDARVSSVELCFGLDGRQQLRATLAAIAKEFDTACTSTFPALRTLTTIPSDSRQLEESWWKGESFVYQLIGIELLSEPSFQHGAWNRPHEILVRKFPIATMAAPVCNPSILTQVRDMNPQSMASLLHLADQQGGQKTPRPIDPGVSLATTV